MLRLIPRLAFAITLPLALGAPSLPAFAQPGFSLLAPSTSGSFIAGQQALVDLRTADAARFFGEAAEADWDNALLVERAFIAYALDGQIERSADVARHLASLDIAQDIGALVLASEAMREARYAEAEKLLTGVTPNSFVTIAADVMRAFALVGNGERDEAEAVLDVMAELGLADFTLYYRALIAELEGETDTAIELMGQAHEAEPLIARYVEVYARMLGNAGRFEEAQAVIDAYFAEGLSHPIVLTVAEQIEAEEAPGPFVQSVTEASAEMLHGVGAGLTTADGRNLGLVLLRLAVYLDPEEDVIALALGQMLDAAGQFEAANAVYEAIPPGSPMSPTAVTRIATNLEATGEPLEAIERLREIVAARPKDLDAVSALGDILRYESEFAEAAEAYTQALSLVDGDRPSDWRFYYVRGIAYERSDQWENAEADFLRALELNPDQPQVLNYLGYSWVDMGMNLEEALEMIERAVAARPDDGYIVDSLGWAFYRLGRLEEAVEVLETAVRLLPDDPEINDHLGDAYWHVGRRQEARFQWQIAIAVDEEGAVTERATPKLEDGLTEENETVEPGDALEAAEESETTEGDAHAPRNDAPATP